MAGIEIHKTLIRLPVPHKIMQIPSGLSWTQIKYMSPSFCLRECSHPHRSPMRREKQLVEMSAKCEVAKSLCWHNQHLPCVPKCPKLLFRLSVPPFLSASFSRATDSSVLKVKLLSHLASAQP